jgi:hypothetical protein
VILNLEDIRGFKSAITWFTSVGGAIDVREGCREVGEPPYLEEWRAAQLDGTLTQKN